MAWKGKVKVLDSRIKGMAQVIFYIGNYLTDIVVGHNPPFYLTLTQ
jgi:hypothetical protein